MPVMTRDPGTDGAAWGSWSYGDVAVRCESLKGSPWTLIPTYVVHDSDDLLVTFLAAGTTLGFPEFPHARWEHPWKVAGHTHWHGHGKLMMQRPGEAYSVDVLLARRGPGVRGVVPQPAGPAHPRPGQLPHPRPRAGLLDPGRRGLGGQGRRAVRAARRGGALHRRAGGVDPPHGCGDRGDADRRQHLVGRVLGELGPTRGVGPAHPLGRVCQICGGVRGPTPAFAASSPDTT